MTSQNFKPFGALLAAALSLLCHGPVHAQQLPANCGALRTGDGWGPFDYRPEGYIPETIYGSHAKLLNIVEMAHFTPEVEALIRGKTALPPGGDINYTLTRFPNHHRALVAVDNLALREKAAQASGTAYTVECFFRRAVAWRPNDRIARMLFAQYLVRNGRPGEAAEQLDAAAKLATDNPFTQYNVGLLYFDMKDYKKALEQAHKAMALGHGLPGLKDKLKGVNAWQEPAPAAEPVPAASAPAASEPEDD